MHISHEPRQNHAIMPVFLLFFCIGFCSQQVFAKLAVPQGWEAEGSLRKAGPPPVRTIDRRAGFIPFSRNYMAPIHSNEIPQQPEITDIFHVTLARGEYEPFTVALYAIHDVAEINISIPGVQAGNNSMSGQQFEIRRIESRAVLPKGKKKKHKRFKLVPSVLRSTSSATLEGGQTTAFWITVHAEFDDLPGIYKGKIIISSQGNILRTLDLQVKVLPFALEEIPSKSFAILYTPTVLSKKLKKNARLLIRDLRIHGMTSYSPIVSAWGQPLGFDADGCPKIEKLINHLEWARQEGFQQPTIVNVGKLIRTGRPNTDANYRKFDERIDLPNLNSIVQYLEEERKRRNWPEIIYLPIDEPGCFTDRAGTRREEIAVNVLRTLRNLGVRGAITVADLVDNKHRELPRWRNVVGWWEKMRPFSSVRIYNNGYPEGKNCLSHEKEDAKQRGHAVMLYENTSTMGISSSVSRMYFGFYGWRTGVEGITSWTHPTWNGATILHAWDDSKVRRQASRKYSEDNWEMPPSTVCWEMVREGIDDYKYLHLFEKRLQETNKQVDKYLSLLSRLQKAVDATRMSEKKPKCDWSGHRFDSFRQLLINGILDLQ